MLFAESVRRALASHAGIELPVRQVARQADARFVVDRDVVDWRRVARFEQPSARQRVRVFGLSDRVFARARIAIRARARVAAGAEILALALPRAIEERRELVLLVDLPGQPAERVANVLIDRALELFALRRDDRLSDIGHDLIGRGMPGGDEKPETVAIHRAAERSVERLHVRDAVAARDVLASQVVVDVVGLPVAVTAAQEHRPAERVAAVLRDHVHPHRRALHFRRVGGGRDRDFLNQRIVHIRPDDVRLLAARAHAVDRFLRLGSVHAVAARVGLFHLAGAADVGRREPDARKHVADREDVAGGWKRVEHVARHDLRARRLRDVDERRLSGHRHRLFERADLHVGVDRGDEVGRQLHAVADDRSRSR